MNLHIIACRVLLTLVAMVFLNQQASGNNSNFSHLSHGDSFTILLNENESYTGTIERINDASEESLILFLSIKDKPDCFLVLRSVHQTLIGTCQMGGVIKHVELLYNKEKNQLVLKEESDSGSILLSERKSLPSF